MEYSVKSATYAMKGKQILSEKGIRSGVGKHIKDSGCVYFIRVSDRYSEIVKEILLKNNIIN